MHAVRHAGGIVHSPLRQGVLRESCRGRWSPRAGASAASAAAKIRPPSRGVSSEAYDAQEGWVGCKGARMGIKLLAPYVRSMDGDWQRLDIGAEKTLAGVRAQLEKKTLIVQNFVQLQQSCFGTA